MLHLWFWTNFEYSYNGSTYDESKLYYIGTQGYQTAIDYSGSGFTQSAKRALCYAVGQMGHYYVQGGLQSGWQGIPAQSNDTFDLIPIFTKPKIINFDTTNTTGVQGPGIISDGWYLSGESVPGAAAYDGPWAVSQFSATQVKVGVNRAATRPDLCIVHPSNVFSKQSASSAITVTANGVIYVTVTREGTIAVSDPAFAILLPTQTNTTISIPLAYVTFLAGAVTGIWQAQYGQLITYETVECGCAEP
jgi:hypothetical protein